VKPITKADLIEFYNTFFSPSSPTRARLSVHLHARNTPAMDKHIIELLQKANLHDVPPQHRQSLDFLEKYLKETAQLDDSRVASIIADAEKAGLKPLTSEENAKPGDIVNGSDAVNKATVIEDIRAFKAGLLASAGAQPVRDLSEFEDTDAKL
jgi:insulysin